MNIKKRDLFNFLFKSLGLLSVTCVFGILVFLLNNLIKSASVEIYIPKLELEITNQDSLDRILSKSFSENEILLIKSLIVNNHENTGNSKSNLLALDLKEEVINYIKYGNKLPQEKKDIIDKLVKDGSINFKFDSNIFTNNNSAYPNQAGIMGSLIGSLFTIFVSLSIAIPIALFLALYLEEFTTSRILIAICEFNINNLSSIPTIVYGLLGVIIYLEYFDLPRSSSIAAGLTLSLIILPIMIFNFRLAFKSIPNNIREAALSLGASKVETIIDHILPLALPKIFSALILAITRIIGETAPLIILGMAAFIINTPKDIYSPATVITTQIYLWANNPNIIFKHKISLVIIMLLIIIILMNLLSMLIKKKYNKI